MDYEKKYKDALSIAKGIHSYSSDITEIKRMEQIFPELAESEDERIRKEIISALKYANHEGVYNKHLAWLEKQGEKPKWTEEDVIRLDRICKTLWKNRKGDTDEIYQQEQDVDWLKTLKQRMEEQQ